LYKQMAISADFDRVFEIGPVFSETQRHLCEFTGLDFEMAIQDHYTETLDIIHGVFKNIFNGLEDRYKNQLEVIREQYPSKPALITNTPCILRWPEAVEILKQEGFADFDEMDYFSSDMELALGAAILKKYGTDFFILDKYPTAIRPFYTMPDPDYPLFSNSYDIFFRGQEICSGAQKCHHANQLENLLKAKNIAKSEALTGYIDSLKHGVAPHAGAGMGLERIVSLYLGLDNVRKASMFPRDSTRCTP